MRLKFIILTLIIILLLVSVLPGESKKRRRKERRLRERRERRKTNVSLWIDEKQVRLFSGLTMKIFAIVNGHVMSHILDPHFEEYLPVIPAEVSSVNFTWKSSHRVYLYSFTNLQSFNNSILQPPTISVRTTGRIPRKPKVFTVFLPCSGNVSGVAGFSIGLSIKTKRGVPLEGTPLKLQLRKECAQKAGPDPECSRKCNNSGWCNKEGICQCQEGYMGDYCNDALCYPVCMNNGKCVKPGVCQCNNGFQGMHCEGGICKERC